MCPNPRELYGCAGSNLLPVPLGCQLDPGATVVWGPAGRGAAAPHPSAGPAGPGGRMWARGQGGDSSSGHSHPQPRLSLCRRTCAPRSSGISSPASCPLKVRPAWRSRMGKTSRRGRGEAELGCIQHLIPWNWAGWLCQDFPVVFAGIPAHPWGLGVPPRRAPAFGDEAPSLLPPVPAL